MTMNESITTPRPTALPSPAEMRARRPRRRPRKTSPPPRPWPPPEADLPALEVLLALSDGGDEHET